jgi:hypothetical protein
LQTSLRPALQGDWQFYQETPILWDPPLCFPYVQFFYILLELVFHGEGCSPPYFTFPLSANNVFLHSGC